MNNVELLIESLLKINLEKLNDDMEDYGKFERMRQTWSHDGATFTKEKKAYNIIMKNGNLKDSDIKAIKNDIAQRGISDTAECKKYFDYLDNFKSKVYNNHRQDIDKLMKELNEVYKNNEFENFEQKLIELGGEIDTINLEKNSEKRAIKEQAKDVEEWMYGKNSFYDKKAQEVFKKYSKIYDEYLKINPKDFDNFKEEYKKLGSNPKSNLLRVNCLLDGLSVDVFGKNNKYSKIISQLGGIMFKNI